MAAVPEAEKEQPAGEITCCHDAEQEGCGVISRPIIDQASQMKPVSSTPTASSDVNPRMIERSLSGSSSTSNASTRLFSASSQKQTELHTRSRVRVRNQARNSRYAHTTLVTTHSRYTVPSNAEPVQRMVMRAPNRAGQSPWRRSLNASPNACSTGCLVSGDTQTPA